LVFVINLSPLLFTWQLKKLTDYESLLRDSSSPGLRACRKEGWEDRETGNEKKLSGCFNPYRNDLYIWIISKIDIDVATFSYFMRLIEK